MEFRDRRSEVGTRNSEFETWDSGFGTRKSEGRGRRSEFETRDSELGIRFWVFGFFIIGLNGQIIRTRMTQIGRMKADKGENR